MVEKQDVECLAGISGASLESMEALLTMLHPPASMGQLALVMTNFQRALQIVDNTPGIRHALAEAAAKSQGSGILSHRPVIDRIVAGLECCKEGGCPEAWLERSGRQRGIINDHPEWAMLILLPEAECYESTAYWQHAGVVLACSALQRNRHQEQIGSEITGACRDIRSIGNGRRALNLLETLSPETTLDDYHQEHLLASEEPRKGFEGIELLVRKVINHTGKTREGGGGGGSGEGQVAPPVTDRHIEASDADDPEREGPERSVQMTEVVGGQAAQNRQRSAGLHPDESQTLRAVSFTESEASPSLGFDLWDLVRRQSRQVQHISQTNQRLPYRYSSLSHVELGEVAKNANRLFSGKTPFAQRDEDGQFAGVLLMLMLWLGRPVAQLLSMRVYPRQSSLPQDRKGLLAYLLEEDAFVLPIPTPAWRNNLQEDAKRLLTLVGGSESALTDDVVIVASPIRVSRLISQLTLERKGRLRYRKLFPETRHLAIEAAMRVAVSKVNRTERMRLTPLRISQALFDEIVRQSSDWVDAALLTGHAFTITEVAAHYYSVSSGYLQTLFHNAVVSLRDNLYRHLNVEESKYYAFYQMVENCGDHGSKLNIKPQLLVQLVRHLKQRLGAARRLPPSDEAWRQVHNHFVAYLAFWTLFATGYRAVNDLVFRWREIDFETGFLVISDKDDESMSQSRVVWLLPQLRDQLRSYAWHLEVLQSRLYQRESLYEHIEDVLSDPQPKVPLLFFISDSWQMAKLSPETLRDQVPIFKLPVNASRHYLRSRLRAEGCRGELVNAFMGHAQQGQEPIGAFSTLSPVEMFAELAPVLETLRREAGWTLQKGMADV